MYLYKFVKINVQLRNQYSKLLWMNTIIHEYRDSNNDERHNEYIKLYKKIMKRRFYLNKED